MQQYHDLVKETLARGVRKKNRTGVDTLSIFSHHSRYAITNSWPVVTSKKLNWKLVLTELLWYLRGEDHIRWLWKNDCHIWDAWADKNGYLGPAYPVLWRRFPKISNYTDYKDDKRIQQEDKMAETYVNEYDQIQNIDNLLRTNPMSRRIVLSTWYPGLESEMGLPPCHLLAIWNCKPVDLEDRMGLAENKGGAAQKFIADLQGGRLENMTIEKIEEELDGLNVPKYVLNCHMTQRSGDIALGIPFNIACYSALTKVLAHTHNMIPGEFSHLIVDAHIYVNHIKGLEQQLERRIHPAPELKINPAVNNIDRLTLDDLDIMNYTHEPAIKFEVAV